MLAGSPPSCLQIAAQCLALAGLAAAGAAELAARLGQAPPTGATTGATTALLSEA